MVDKFSVGMLCLGIMVGLIFPGFPAPLELVNPFLWVAFLIIALFLFLKK